MNKIKAVIFDFGGVLMRTMTDEPRREFERQMGLPPGRFAEVAYGSPLWDPAQLGHITYEEFWQDVGRRLGLDLSLEEARELGNTFWSGDQLDEEMMALVRHLRGQGYRTAMLSNAPSYLKGFVEELGIAGDFDVSVISGCEGLMKPEPPIFNLTLERLEVAPEEAVFVDDRRENVEAAKQLGMKAIRFRGLAPLRRELEALGLPLPPVVREPIPGIRAVIFDWGGVLEVLLDKAHVAGWEQRLALKPGTLLAALWGKGWEQVAVGEISEVEYAARIAERLGLPNAQAGLKFLEDFYVSGRLQMEVLETVRSLRGRYKVALLTDASESQAEWIRRRYGVDVTSEFDVYVNSAHVGLRKPDPAIYRLTLERLGVSPGEAVFLDDLIRNVDGARFLGIHAIQFVEPESSLAELRALLGVE